MKTVFVSFIGNRDPYDARPPHQKTEESLNGPALSLISQLEADEKLRFDEVWFLYSGTPNAKDGIDYQKSFQSLQAALQHLNVKGHVLGSAAADARTLLQEISRLLGPLKQQGIRLHLNTNSGTPQMTEAFKILAATGWFQPAQVQLWQTIEPKYRKPDQEGHRKYTLPYLTEALLLHEAFVAFKRYNFGQAQSIFSALEQQALEIPGRQERMGYLAQISEALQLLNQKKYNDAHTLLKHVQVRIQMPELQELVSFLDDLQSQVDAREPNDASVWEGWARIDRYRDTQDALGGVIWADILNEMVVWYLCKKRGLPDTINDRHPTLGSKLHLIASEYPNSEVWRRMDPKRGITINKNHVVRVQLIRSQAAGLYPEAVGKVLESRLNPIYDEVVTVRNEIVHENGHATLSHLEKAVQFSHQVIQIYPFNLKKQQGKYKTWVTTPDDCPTSAQGIRTLASKLQEWLG